MSVSLLSSTTQGNDSFHLDDNSTWNQQTSTPTDFGYADGQDYPAEQMSSHGSSSTDGGSSYTRQDSASLNDQGVLCGPCLHW